MRGEQMRDHDNDFDGVSVRARPSWSPSSGLPRRPGTLNPAAASQTRNVLRTTAPDPQVTPDLDAWLPNPAIRVHHRRESSASAERLWEAAQAVRLSDSRRLGRLVRWRIPGLPADLTFGELFRAPPFIVLDETPDRMLVS